MTQLGLRRKDLRGERSEAPSPASPYLILGGQKHNNIFSDSNNIIHEMSLPAPHGSMVDHNHNHNHNYDNNYNNTNNNPHHFYNNHNMNHNTNNNNNYSNGNINTGNNYSNNNNNNNNNNSSKYRYRYKKSNNPTTIGGEDSGNYNNNNNNNNGGIDNRKLERRQSIKIVDTLLSQRPKQEELEEKNIMMMDRTYYKRMENKQQIKTKLTQRLSNKFRPDKEDLVSRGILLTPDTDDNNAKWVLESKKKRDSINLRTKFISRPSPQDLLEKRILTAEDYEKMNGDAIQEWNRPTSHTTSQSRIISSNKNNNNNNNNNNNKNNHNNNSNNNSNHNEKNGHHFVNPYTTEAKLRAQMARDKIQKHQPNTEPLIKNEKISENNNSNQNNRKIIRTKRNAKGRYISGHSPVEQNKKRESNEIREFLKNRPSPQYLVDRHVLSPEDVLPYIETTPTDSSFSHSYQSPSNNNNNGNTNYSNGSRPEQSLVRKTSQGPKRYYLRRVPSKIMESSKIENFLERRPTESELWEKNILPSLPPSERNSLKNHRKRILKRKLSNEMRPTVEDLERRGIVPMGGLDDPVKANERVRKHRQESVYQLELKFLQRPAAEELITNGIIPHYDEPSTLTTTDTTPLSLGRDSLSTHRSSRPRLASNQPSMAPPPPMWNNTHSRASLDSGIVSINEEDTSKNPRRYIKKNGIAVLNNESPHHEENNYINDREKTPESISISTSKKTTPISMTSDMRRAHIETQHTEMQKRMNAFEQEHMKNGNKNTESSVHEYGYRSREEKEDIYGNSEFYSRQGATKSGASERPKRRLTLELKEMMQSQLNERSFQHDTLPSQIYQMEDILKHHYDQKQPLNEMDIQLLLQRLKDIRLAHENALEDLKQKSWNVLVDQKNRFKDLQAKYDEMEDNYKQQMWSWQRTCDTLELKLKEKKTAGSGHSNNNINNNNTNHNFNDATTAGKRNGDIVSKDPISVLSALSVQLSSMTDTDNTTIEEVVQKIKEQITKLSLRGNEKLKKGQVSMTDLRESKRDAEKLHTEVKILKAEKQELLLTHEKEIRKLRTSFEMKLKEKNSALTEMKNVADVRLIQEMDELRDEYENKLNDQRRQTIELRKIMDDNIDRAKELEDIKKQFQEKDTMIVRLQRELHTAQQKIREIEPELTRYKTHNNSNNSNNNDNNNSNDNNNNSNSNNSNKNSTPTPAVLSTTTTTTKIIIKTEEVKESEAILYNPECDISPEIEWRIKYVKLLQCKKMLEKQVLELSQQLIDLSNDIR